MTYIVEWHLESSIQSQRIPMEYDWPWRSSIIPSSILPIHQTS
ncbi:hypothetical protein AB6A40_008162 [Gnathostoma spinigerum]|uniref:Cytochrome oxidase subunit I n=1 Tax=Gnathostoma spinigerum TaxID=75299 RepID=A0ABD6ENK7_9BILA